MSRYDGLIIPRSYSEYINKTDAATLSQALALPGVMDAAPTKSSNKAARSGGIYSAIDAVKPVDTVTLNNMQSVTSNAVYEQLEGCKLKSFAYTVGSVVAGNVYRISKTALGLPVNAGVVGISLTSVGGVMQWDFNAALFYNVNTAEFLFSPQATQDKCGVSGVVFYK